MRWVILCTNMSWPDTARTRTLTFTTWPGSLAQTDIHEYLYTFVRHGSILWQLTAYFHLLLAIFYVMVRSPPARYSHQSSFLLPREMTQWASANGDWDRRSIAVLIQFAYQGSWWLCFRKALSPPPPPPEFLHYYLVGAKASISPGLQPISDWDEWKFVWFCFQSLFSLKLIAKKSESVSHS